MFRVDTDLDQQRFDTDPDPRIPSTGLQIRIWIRIQILLFPVGGFQDDNKNKFQVFLLVTVETFTSVFEDSKILLCQKPDIKDNLIFLLSCKGLYPYK